MRKTTITINGRLYDAITGMPVTESNAALAKPQPQQQASAARPHVKQFSDIGPQRAPQPVAHKPVVSRQHHAAAAVHQRPRRSETLNRQIAPKPIALHNVAPQPVVDPTPHIAEPTRSPMISRFAPMQAQPVPVTPPTPEPPASEPRQDLQAPPMAHPVAVKALQHRAAAAPVQHHTSKELKEQLIKERLAEVGNNNPERPPKKSFFARKPKLASILVSSLSLLILGGYFSYINLTNISMRVAANRAGIHANFPNYRPSGYSLNGPITYAPGEVTISFKSNTNENGFSLTQKASEWDSQAVLDNYVRKQSANYLTIQERGITVYTFNNKAAWVNGGLLHTVEGDAMLSSDQILRLATSL